MNDKWELRQSLIWVGWLTGIKAWAEESAKLTAAQQLSLSNLTTPVKLQELRDYNARKNPS